MADGDVKAVADNYATFFDRSKGDEGISERRKNYTTVVNSYYDLVTDFYEYGWGQAFHFGPRTEGQSFDSSLVGHEQRLADFLKVGKGQRILDVGCGVGGPMRARLHATLGLTLLASTTMHISLLVWTCIIAKVDWSASAMESRAIS
jgi:sterol 24-C-methyltransferase